MVSLTWLLDFFLEDLLHGFTFLALDGVFEMLSGCVDVSHSSLANWALVCHDEPIFGFISVPFRPPLVLYQFDLFVPKTNEGLHLLSFLFFNKWATIWLIHSHRRIN